MRVDGMTTANQNQVNLNSNEQEKVAELNLEKQTANNEEIKQQNKASIYNEDELIQIIEEANQDILFYDRKFEFSIHEDTKAIMVKVINAGTDEIIREIPPEKILDMVAKMWEMAGIFVDEKV